MYSFHTHLWVRRACRLEVRDTAGSETRATSERICATKVTGAPGRRLEIEPIALRRGREEPSFSYRRNFPERAVLGILLDLMSAQVDPDAALMLRVREGDRDAFAL